MSLSSHIEELKKKHHALSEQVEEAQRAPSSSTLYGADQIGPAPVHDGIS